jgi:hypothetical protein
MDLEEMLARATAELEAAEAEYRAAQQRLDDLRTMREGMRLAMERYGPATPENANSGAAAGQPVNGTAQGSEPTAGANVKQTAHGQAHGVLAAPKRTAASTRRPKRRTARRQKPAANQTDICIAALAEFGRAASNAEIRERLSEQGHNFDAEQVRSAFSYLMRRERVVRVQPGVWALAPGPAAPPPSNSHAVSNGAESAR